MIIFLDGQALEVPEKINLADLLRQRGQAGSHALVEVNGKTILAKDHANTWLQPEDRAEVIYPAFGG